ncbi:hypothetical protein BDB00DRAFT_388668 [Zychaea mexicana]|uniref:uncharacterized protein n=1 Tax=Zychaea mexicana TaxID=64656 RepID=UPI0022FDE985|nr:uncharacterized protein BDB00DRAFT_388668 [Zychaea mexicana]KAI9493189.1 hypothetical protein BDB00DRAFT_388668 [Zychaea mexicana]
MAVSVESLSNSLSYYWSECPRLLTTLPSDTTFWPKEAPPPSSPQSPVFMGNTLQIPRLTTTPSSPPPSTTTASSNTIRQSLSLVPSTSTTLNSSLLQRPSPTINRSSSVKLTKYDHRHAYAPARMERRRTADSDNGDDDDDDEDEEELGDGVQLRRAVSVNKKQGLSRSASLGARTTTGEMVPVVYARPTMVRINTITRKEGGITRKASVRTVISSSPVVEQEPPAQANNNDDPRRLRTESWNSQHSIANSAHSSVGDGEITVYWDSPPNRQQQPPQ